MPIVRNSRAISGSGWISARARLRAAFVIGCFAMFGLWNENFAEIGTTDTQASCKLYTAVA